MQQMCARRTAPLRPRPPCAARPSVTARSASPPPTASSKRSGACVSQRPSASWTMRRCARARMRRRANARAHAAACSSGEGVQPPTPPSPRRACQLSAFFQRPERPPGRVDVGLRQLQRFPGECALRPTRAAARCKGRRRPRHSLCALCCGQRPLTHKHTHTHRTAAPAGLCRLPQRMLAASRRCGRRRGGR